jgi:aspartyl protease family protein
MLKQAAVVFAGVLVATSAALWLMPMRQAPLAAPVAAHPSSAVVAVPAEPPLRGAAAPAPHTDASVHKSDDGHFWAEAQANGRHVRFLVDTGATTVALTATDAERLGLDLKGMAFDVPVRTASGEARAAAVKLDYVSVAGARVENVEALVVREGLTASLLGMSYLGRLSRFEATQSALILRP